MVLWKHTAFTFFEWPVSFASTLPLSTLVSSTFLSVLPESTTSLKTGSALVLAAAAAPRLPVLAPPLSELSAK